MNITNGTTIILHTQLPSDVHITTKKIMAFRRLTDGWHYGEGYHVDESVVNTALELHKRILSLGLYETDAFPGIEGNIVLTVYSGTECLEFTLMSNGNIQYCRERDDVEVCEEVSLTILQAENILKDFRQGTCRQFDFSTLDTMIAAKNAFVPRHLHVLGMGFQLWMNNAS